MTWRTVEDPADPALDAFRRLTDAQLRRSIEADAGMFIAESLHVVRRVLETHAELVRTVVVTPHAADRLADVLATTPAEVLVAEAAVLASVAGFDVHRGVLAAVARPPQRSVEEVLGRSRRVALLEDLTDQANVGTLFRSAAALGIDAVLCSPRCVDPLYRRTVRTSMGEVLRVPWARLDPWPDGFSVLHRHGFTVDALTPDGEHRLVPPPADRRVAVLLGSEADGVSDAARAAADRRVSIAMRGGVDSLNVAAAGAIAFAAYGLVAG